MPAENEEPRVHGDVILHPSKGTIKVEGAGADIFLHVKEMRKCGILALNDGTQVSFTAIKGPKGFYATDIKVLST